jgi:hypothetical protein
MSFSMVTTISTAAHPALLLSGSSVSHSGTMLSLPVNKHARTNSVPHLFSLSLSLSLSLSDRSLSNPRQDGTVRLWSTHDGRCLDTFSVPAGTEAQADAGPASSNATGRVERQGTSGSDENGEEGEGVDERESETGPFVLRVACCPGRELAIAVVAQSDTAYLLNAVPGGIRLVSTIRAPAPVWSAVFVGTTLMCVCAHVLCALD